MKKIIVGASILALNIASFSSVSANHHGENMMENTSYNMMEKESEYGMFSSMVRDNLSMDEKTELKSLVEKQKEAMVSIKAIVEKVQSGKLDAFEEFNKIVPKRKMMIEKLKPFMENSSEFEAMCLKHGNKLISKLFTKEDTVLKYKSILEKKSGLKNKIEKIYNSKGIKFEKIIHKVLNKNIESKNTKNVTVLIALNLIIQDIKEESKMGNQMNEEFGGFTKFVKKDLTEIEKKALKGLLAEREAAIIKFKKMLTDAKANGTFEETFKVVENKRAGCQARFSLYLDESKKEEFKTHCKSMGQKLKASFE